MGEARPGGVTLLARCTGGGRDYPHKTIAAPDHVREMLHTSRLLELAALGDSDGRARCGLNWPAHAA